MNKNDVLKIISNTEYLSVTDLRYNQKKGFLFSKEKFNLFLKTKDELISEHNELFINIPLKSFSTNYIFYVDSLYLKKYFSEYIRILSSDYEYNHSNLFNRHIDEIIKSYLFSEIEGTLNIENVPTTHKRIAELYKTDEVKDQNDIIVKNMFKAIQFIVTDKPEFTKENLFILYKILTNNCLTPECAIKPGNYYRDDKVYIANHEGAPVDNIDECMNSLFDLVNNSKKGTIPEDILPHICHYYILYIHPYFDFNGRTARVVAFWLSYIRHISTSPLFISEAINETKHEYYDAIENSRNTNNDLTYFLGYIFKTSIKYSLIYKNLEEMKLYFDNKGDYLTTTEWVYVKKILIHNSLNYFHYKQFLKYINCSMSKQGATKFLNKFAKYKILNKQKNTKGEVIYKVNESFITYIYVD